MRAAPRPAYARRVPTVELTSHLQHHFASLRQPAIPVEARTVAEAVAALDAIAPGFAFYVCDEAGRLRQHVLVYVGGRRVTDRATLTDPLDPDARVLIVQALSGG
jgi:molybdopterin synthase sulfur carrier subunit